MDFPSSGPVTLRTNLSEYPVTSAIRSGVVSSPIVRMDFCGPPVAHDGFKAMVRENKYDCGELAIVTYLQARVYNKPYVLLPTPISGRFQHHVIGYNVDFGDVKPKDIEGHKVGVRTYAQTTCLWARGILQHEFGVDLDKVTWMTIDEGHLAEYADPPNCERLPKGSKLDEMMMKGELKAAILGAYLPDDPRVRSLVPNPQEAAKEWHARMGLIPINHMFAIHRDLSKQRPDVVKEIFRMIVEGRKHAPEKAVATIPPIGLEANRKGLELAIDWAYEQKIIPRRLRVDELFDDVTASLTA